LADHPRFQAHYTPKHASWLDQAELFFSILTRRLLRRGEFTSRQHNRWVEAKDSRENYLGFGVFDL